RFFSGILRCAQNDTGQGCWRRVEAVPYFRLLRRSAPRNDAFCVILSEAKNPYYSTLRFLSGILRCAQNDTGQGCWRGVEAVPYFRLLRRSAPRNDGGGEVVGERRGVRCFLSPATHAEACTPSQAARRGSASGLLEDLQLP